MRTAIFALLGLGVLAFYYFSSPPGDQSWVHGKWVLQTKVSDSVIESFSFNPDGTMVFGNADGIVYDSCTYSFFTKTTIDFECDINGRKAVFPLEVSAGNSVITMTTGDTFAKVI